MTPSKLWLYRGPTKVKVCRLLGKVTPSKLWLKSRAKVKNRRLYYHSGFLSHPRGHFKQSIGCYVESKLVAVGNMFRLHFVKLLVGVSSTQRRIKAWFMVFQCVSPAGGRWSPTDYASLGPQAEGRRKRGSGAFPRSTGRPGLFPGCRCGCSATVLRS